MSGKRPEHLLWIDKAEEDRLCVANELKALQKPWSVVCFHAQQAAEKYLKAFLVRHGIRPERTHDLRVLLNRCAQVDLALLPLENDCRQLNDYAVDIRYPDIGVTVEETMTRNAVAASDRICDLVRSKI